MMQVYTKQRETEEQQLVFSNFENDQVQTNIQDSLLLTTLLRTKNAATQTEQYKEDRHHLKIPE